MDSSYIPLNISSDISSLNSLTFRTNDNNYFATNDYSSYYNSTSSTYYSNVPIVDVIDPLFSFNIRNDRCLVCNDRSSGIHFGVLTCEACKAFFRRTTLSTYSISSPCSPNRCEINVKNRNNCPACRFDKCKRLGMDRDNVIYGKQSKQQQLYNQNSIIEQLKNILQELMRIYQTTSLTNTYENKQQIERFVQILFQIFYSQTIQTHNVNLTDIIQQIFQLISSSYKNNIISDRYLVENISLHIILSIWLFVYYYDTFILKDKISQDKLTILIKLLDIELINLNQYSYNNEKKIQGLRINFLNTFTIFTDRLQNSSLNIENNSNMCPIKHIY